jgi:hypothetical protein
MRLFGLLAVMVLAACGQAAATPASHPSSTSSTSTAARVFSTPTPPTPPAAAVSCVPGAVPSYQALVLGSEGTFLYDVTDPVHPRAACRIVNTVARVVTGTAFEYLVPNADGTTSVVLHALGSNNESVRATFRADLYHVNGWQSGVAWLPGTDQMAYFAGGGTDANGLGVTDVWLATPSGRTKIYSYAVPGKDTFGRPGFAPQTLAFSSDGGYLAAGWSVALNAVRVFRLSDRADVTPPLPADFRFAFWSRSGLTLYMVGGSTVSRWTPGGVVTPEPHTPSWILDPDLSPDGEQVAFTSVSSSRDVRANVYELISQTNRVLSDQPRSSAMFVKTGWIWDIEEKPCVQATNQTCFDPTVPDGTVLATDLATGHETAVAFAAGEAPTRYSIVAGDLWPKT